MVNTYINQVSSDSIIRRYESSYVFKMPKNSKYNDYRFMLDKKNISENGDGTVFLTFNSPITIRRMNTEVKLSMEEMFNILAAADNDKDFKTEYITIKVPNKDITHKDNMVFVKNHKGNAYTNSRITFSAFYESNKDENNTYFNLPEWLHIPMAKDNETVFINPSELADITKNW